MANGGDQRNNAVGGSSHHDFFIERPQILDRSAPAGDDQQIRARDWAVACKGVEAADRRGNFLGRTVALHPDRPHHDMAREPLGKAVQDIANHRPTRRGDHADNGREIGQALLTRLVEQALRRELPLALLQQRHQRAKTRGFQALDDNLVGRAPRICGEPAGGDDLEPFLGPDPHAGECGSPNHCVDSRAFILEGKIGVARGMGTAVAGNFAANPHKAKGVLDRALERGREFRHGPFRNVEARLVHTGNAISHNAYSVQLGAAARRRAQSRDLDRLATRRRHATPPAGLFSLRLTFMNILILGSGGREHALAWKLAASPLTDRLYCAPGNAGIAQEAECVAMDNGDHQAVVAFCKDHAIDFVIVGPEIPLVAGIVDDLEAAGIKAFGPSRAAARLEGSKGFTKDLCRANEIPTAAYERFAAAGPAKDYARRAGAPIVIKADGLAAGKGVVVATTLAEADAAIDMMFDGAPGEAGTAVVVEEFLAGEEASFFVLCDGDGVVPLATAQDHKRAFDGDQGPNTGGMGAYSPAPVMTPDLERRALNEIVLPTVRAMRAMATPYRGVLYAGLMITAEGPKLIEYNVRFGDPECQVLMLRLLSDLLPALIATRDGVLKTFALRWHPEAALTVVMAARGYPGDYAKGSEIVGLADAAKIEGVEIFHAGTRGEDGRIVANGGRVLNVCALGKTVAQAQACAYEAVDRIRWPEGFYRRDIGFLAVEREKGRR